MSEWIPVVVQIVCTLVPMALLIIRNGVKTQAKLEHVDSELAKLVGGQEGAQKERRDMWKYINRHETRITVIESTTSI